MFGQSYSHALPVGKILAKALGFSLFNFPRLLIWSLPASLIMAGIIWVIEFARNPAAIMASIPLIYLLTMVAITPVAVTIHRKIILKENYTTNYFAFFFKIYFWKFFINTLFILLTFTLFLLLSSALFPGIHYVISIPIAVLVFGRFSLILPMSAIQQHGWIRVAWSLSRGNTLDIFFTNLLMDIFMAAVVAILLLYARPFIDAQIVPLAPAEFSEYVSTLGGWVLAVFPTSLLWMSTKIAALSYIYEDLS